MDNSNNLLAAWPVVGPGIAGAVFGAGWWFWVDAVVCSAAAVPFLHYLPGFFASFAALMFNCVNREDIGDGYYSPYDNSEWSTEDDRWTRYADSRSVTSRTDGCFPSHSVSELAVGYHKRRLHSANKSAVGYRKKEDPFGKQKDGKQKPTQRRRHVATEGVQDDLVKD